MPDEAATAAQRSRKPECVSLSLPRNGLQMTLRARVRPSHSDRGGGAVYWQLVASHFQTDIASIVLSHSGLNSKVTSHGLPAEAPTLRLRSGAGTGGPVVGGRWPAPAVQARSNFTRGLTARARRRRARARDPGRRPQTLTALITTVAASAGVGTRIGPAETVAA